MSTHSFDAKAYKAVTKDAGRGALADSIKAVRQDLDRDPDSTSFYKLDLRYLFGVPEGATENDLKAWHTELHQALNKSARNGAPGPTNVKLLLETLDKFHPGMLLRPDFWAKFSSQHKEADNQRLVDLLNRMAQRSALSAATPEQVRAEAQRAGFGDVSDRELTGAAQKSNLHVVEEVELSDSDKKLTGALSQLWNKLSFYNEFLTVVHAIRFHDDAPVRDIKVFGTLSANGRAITHAEIDASLKRMGRQASTDYVEPAKKFLDRLSSEASTADDLARITIAALASEIISSLDAGTDPGDIVKRWTDNGLDKNDALRLVVTLDAEKGGAEGKVSPTDQIDAALAEGDLARAENLVVTFKDSDDEVFAQAEARVKAARQRKNELLAQYESATTQRDFEQAESALHAAQALDAGDSSIADKLAALPPGPVAQVRWNLSGQGVELSWTPSPTADVVYIVKRRKQGVPNWSTIVNSLQDTNYVDTTAPHGATLEYAVEARRSSGLHSEAVLSAPALIAPKPSNVSVTTGPTSITVTWTLPESATSTIVEVRGPQGFHTREEVHQGTTFGLDGLKSGVTYSIRIAALYRTSGAEVMSDPVETTATPRTAAAPPEDFQFEISAQGISGEVLQVQWTVVDGYSSELWAFPQGASLSWGTVLTPNQAQDKGGEQLLPLQSRKVSATTYSGTFPLPAEPSRMVPAVLTDRGLMFGDSTFVGSAKAVELPEATLLGDDVRISFVWPKGNVDVDVAWMQSGQPQRTTVTYSAYRRNSGVLLPHAATISDITLTTVLDMDGDLVRSKPVRVNYTPPRQMTEVRYEVELKKSLFGGKYTCVVTAVSPVPGLQVPVTLLHKPGGIMPGSISDGYPLVTFTLNCGDDGLAREELELGKFRPPFWIRLFSTDPNVILFDPPTPHLKA